MDVGRGTSIEFVAPQIYYNSNIKDHWITDCHNIIVWKGVKYRNSYQNVTQRH